MRPTARDVLDADGWFDWNEHGDIVSTKGPHEGERLYEVSVSRLVTMSWSKATPESTRAVLRAFIDTPRAATPQSEGRRRRRELDMEAM